MKAEAKKRVGIILMIASVLIMSGAPASAGPNVMAEDPTQVLASPTITVTHEEAHIVVEPEEEGPTDVQSSGVVIADAVGPGSNTQSIRVELWAGTDQGWPVTVEPGEMTFPPGGGSEDFVWFASVAGGNESINGTVTFSGRAMMIPGGTRQTIIPDSVVMVEVLAIGGDEDTTTGEDGNAGDPDDGGSAGLYAALAVVVLIFIAVIAFIMMRKRRGKTAPAKKPSRKQRVGKK